MPELNTMSKINVRCRAGIWVGILSAAIMALGGTIPAAAEHTRFWRQSDYENFDRGTAKGTAVSSDGRIMLAPKFAPLAPALMASRVGFILPVTD